MRQSVYLRIAVFFVQLDLQREDAAWRREHRRVCVLLPHLSQHMLKDIGVDKDQRIARQLVSSPASRKVRHLRREYQSRLST
ncbi:hypothetical protein C9I98_14140 [Photobacterium sanctipauli]|uniref:DUF1127 domain-containing protein n=1 Tax=Photobacterium sanctipauli TaxID=1342794 RepID=A0A2T3NRZ0_9GAMM|nr:hypothetical protein [Photobacterium sanctipauli]PSW18985.1 hypothetical protein C9I98_14140 [Photobacterium sanctipauli]